MRAVLKGLWSARRALAVYALLILLGAVFGGQLKDLAIPEMRPMNEPMIHRIVMTALAVFVIAAALPFVPGAEIGLALLLAFGGQAAPVVYVGMVGALLLSYSVARLVPPRLIAASATWLGLPRIARAVDTIADTPFEGRAATVTGALKGRIGKAAMRNRYVLLAVLLNMPGNSVLGGGGGLAFAAGLSGLYRFWPYLLSVLLAVLPIPLFFYLFDNPFAA